MEDKLILKKETFEPIKIEWIKQSGLDERVFAKEVSFALQILSNSVYLQGASKDSVLKAVLNIAQIGLTLNPVSKYAYLVPRYNNAKKQLEAILDPSYQGYAKLLTDSGTVISMQCNLFYEGDLIEVDFASERKIVKHVPYMLNGKPKGKILGVYSLASLPDKSYHVELMSLEEIYDIRERSESYKSFVAGKTKACIWTTDEAEMCRKTVIKRHYKYLPKSGNMEKIEKAIDLDNNVNGFKPSDGKLALIESLIYNSILPEDQKVRLENNLDTISDNEASSLIGFLKENQKKNLDQQLDATLRTQI